MRIRTNRGFTIIELAIALVVIGLIVGGVLGGREVMQSARINNAVNGLQSFQASVQTYQQNFSALPGDDPSAATRFSNVDNPGNGDGLIGTSDLNQTYNITTSGHESRTVWEHLRAAGLAKANDPKDAQPFNPFNGKYGIQHGAFSGNNGWGANGNVVCMDTVPGEAATAIDARLDDGQPDTGNLRGGTSVTEAPATGYTQGSAYVLCTPL